MSKSKMLAARELIEEKNYTEARRILKTVDHPKAAEWLAKLDRIAPEEDLSEIDDPFGDTASSSGSNKLLGYVAAVISLIAFAIGGVSSVFIMIAFFGQNITTQNLGTIAVIGITAVVALIVAYAANKMSRRLRSG